MPPRRDTDSIRPRLLVAAGLLVVLLALGGGAAIRATSRAGSDAATEHGDRGGRTFRLESSLDDDDGFAARLEDPGAQGSAREAWARAFEDRRERPPPLVEALVDPQLHRFSSSFDRDTPPPFAPLGRRGRIVSARGLDLDSASPCEVRVLPVADGGYNCQVRVMCGRTVVYPNRAQTAGYVACELASGAPTTAADQSPSVTDGDPAIAFDLARGTVTVSDSDREGRTLFELTLALDASALQVM